MLFYLGFQDNINYAFSPANYSFKSLFISGFLYLNLGHLLSNCLSMLIIGYVLEGIIGRGKFMMYFIICNLLSDVFLYLYYNSDSNTLSQYYRVIGASGGLCCLMSFLLTYALITKKFSLVMFSLYSLVPNLSFELKSQGVSVEGHIAGAIAGVLLCLVDYILHKLRKSL